MFNTKRDKKIEDLDKELGEVQSTLDEGKADYKRLNANYNDLTERVTTIENPNPFSCGDKVTYDGYKDNPCTIIATERLPFDEGYLDEYPYRESGAVKSYWSYTLTNASNCIVKAPNYTARIMESKLTPWTAKVDIVSKLTEDLETISNNLQFITAKWLEVQAQIDEMNNPSPFTCGDKVRYFADDKVYTVSKVKFTAKSQIYGGLMPQANGGSSIAIGRDSYGTQYWNYRLVSEAGCLIPEVVGRPVTESELTLEVEAPKVKKGKKDKKNLLKG